jgi:hypothetical protein
MWTKEMINFLTNNYYLLDREQLQEKLNKTWNQIVAKAFALKLKRSYTIRRTYKINEHYFDTIDSNDKAYFLGLLFADGYNNQKHGLISISLIKEDSKVLNKLSEKIYLEPKELYHIQSNLGCSKPQEKLVISNRNISNQLLKYGCFQNKSQTLSFPNNIKKELIPHFIRGYFDGDGCIYINKNNYPTITIIGTYNFCLNINSYIKDIGKIYKTPSDKMFILKLNGKDKIKYFYNIIYKDQECIKLDRKYNKFINYLSGEKY